jgi:hypothetical protein
MRRVLGPQDADGMRMKRDGYSGSAGAPGVVARTFEHRAVAEMHAIEDANGEEEGAGELRER